MSSRQKLINATVKHQVFLQRYAGGVFKELLPFINDLEKKVEKLIFDAPPLQTRKRRAAILKELKRLQTLAVNNLSKSVRQQMRELVKYELDFTKRMLENSTTPGINYTVPTIKQVTDAAFTSIMDARPGYSGTQGLTIGNALSEFGTNKGAEIARTIRGGFALGESNQDLASKVSGLIGGQYKRQAESLTRTITNHVASQSRQSFYEENNDILGDYKIIATLDGRTTYTCMALDGKLIPPKDFSPPPYHWNCRTSFIRVPKKEYDLGSEVTGTRVARDPVTNKNTQVNSQTTYNSWLKDQSDKFQNEVLGTKRAELFRRGMHVDKFVDKNYQPITLDQLRTNDNKHIFEAAGI